MAPMQMMLVLSVLCILTVCVLAQSKADDLLNKALREKEATVHILKKLDPIKVERRPSGQKSLDIFCYNGNWQPLAQRIPKLFTTANLKLAITSDDYELFHGYNESQAYYNYVESTQSFLKFTLPWRADNIQLLPFNKTCIGITAQQDYAVRFRIKVLDPWLITYLIIGLVLFFSADRLSKNVVFYYGTGVSIGMLASLLILVFIMSKFVPYRKGVYVMLVGGWSVVLWCFRYLWDNYSSILESNWHYVAGYFSAAGLVSFAVCYWKGPVTDTRSLNLIKWTIQSLGLLLMFNSTQIQEVSIAIIVIVVTFHNFPRSVNSFIKRVWRRLVPQRLRLLTEEEYFQQGNEETRRALEELREYCKSPKCDAWKVISKLRTPQRFAQWVEGDSHLSEDEMFAFDDNPTSMPSTPEISEDEVDFRLSSQ